MQVQDDSKPYDTINVTPMLDLAYVLLVVFILMTTASVQGMNISIPKPAAKPATEKHEMHVLSVMPDGSVRLDGAPKSDEQLKSELQTIKARDAGATVVIEGKDEARYERVVAMIDLCTTLQVGMSIATTRIGF